jgi:flagellar biosynthesis/type III secretory pathway M-ring protein FliF/YscJ
MNKFYLYISKEDELGEIIEKIKKAKGREVVLVIPEKTKSLSHPANLEIFRREIKDLDKKIYLSTTDEKIKTLARNLNLPIFLEETEEKIFDIKPPKKKEEQEEQEEQIITQSKPKLTFNFIKIFSYIFILIVISLLAFILFQVFQTKAEIIIETKKLTFDINEVISIKEDQVSPDYENKSFTRRTC